MPVRSPDRRGVFDVLLALVRRGLGGKVGDGHVSGRVNLALPNRPPQTEFMRVLRKAWGMPGRLLEAGFEFSFPAWPEAADDLVHRWRRLRRGNRARGG